MCAHQIEWAGKTSRKLVLLPHRNMMSSLLDLLPPPSPLVPYPSPLSEQGIHLPAFHPLLPWEPSPSLPCLAFVHPLSPCLCLGNINPLVAGFVTPPHSTPSPQPPPQGAIPHPTSPTFVHPPSPRLRLGNVNTSVAAVRSGPIWSGPYRSNYKIRSNPGLDRSLIGLDLANC